MFLGVGIWIAGLVFLGPMSIAAEQTNRNLVLITLDTVRADYLSCEQSADPTPRRAGSGGGQLHPHPSLGAADAAVPRIHLHRQPSADSHRAG